MSAAVRESKWTWILAALASIAAVAAVMALFRPPAAPAPPPPAGVKPTVELPVPGHPSSNDRAAFKDPTSLFLPTEWNSSPPDQERREPEGTFKGYGPKYSFAENDLQLSLPAFIAVPPRPAEALVQDAPGNPYLGIGQTDADVAALAPRWAFVEIVAAATGRRVFAQALVDAAEAKEAIPALREGNWQPLEFMAAVDASGLVGQLIPMAWLDTADDDPFLQLQGESLAMLENYLAQKLRVGDRLSPGFYRISVGP